MHMVKFRNRIVHLYQEVDDSEIYRILRLASAEGRQVLSYFNKRTLFLAQFCCGLICLIYSRM